MNLIGAKIYFDGSHWIAIPHTERPPRKRKSPPPLTEQEEKQLQEFEKAFKKNFKGGKKRGKRKAQLLKDFEPQFDTTAEAAEFVEKHFERLSRNAWERFKRMKRRAYLYQWSYFVTFTYSPDITAEEFEKRLLNCLHHLHDRRGWRYIGVWEYGELGERKHFHALVYVPDGQMVGELYTDRSYSTKRRRWEERVLNTFFVERFGRTEFSKIENTVDVEHSVGYMLKYMVKDDIKAKYSRGLKTYMISDILDEDIICPIGDEEHGFQYILSDKFTCIVEGEIIGEVSPETIEKMPKAD